MKPTLYYLKYGPPSRAVLMVAKEIGLDVELKEVDILGGAQLDPEFIKLNPQHTVPFLIDNGVGIVDSHAICEYICTKYAKPEDAERLYPKDIVKRSLISARNHFESGFLFARLRFLVEPILYYGAKEISQENVDYLKKLWDIMEGFLANSPYLVGDNYTIADLSCIATISSVADEMKHDPAKHTKLDAWIKRMEKLPCYKECNIEGAEALKTLLPMKLAENQAK